MSNVLVQPIEDRHRDAMQRLVRERWGTEIVVVHDTVYRPYELPGFVKIDGEDVVGFATYALERSECEIVSLLSLRPGRGVGSALVAEVEAKAGRAGCSRVWLVTTNDNLDALRFYQRRGYELVRVDRGAVGRARRLKPEIPLIGQYGIPMRDEIELERRLRRGE